MSGSELERVKFMAGVEEEEVTLVAASGLMGVGYRRASAYLFSWNDCWLGLLSGKHSNT